MRETFDPSLLNFPTNRLSESQLRRLIAYSLSKGHWTDEECAHYIGSNENIQHKHRLIEITSSWDKPSTGAHPFWYLNEAAKRKVPSNYTDSYIIQAYHEEITYIFDCLSKKDQEDFQKKYEYLYGYIAFKCKQLAEDAAFQRQCRQETKEEEERLRKEKDANEANSDSINIKTSNKTSQKNTPPKTILKKRARKIDPDLLHMATHEIRLGRNYTEFEKEMTKEYLLNESTKKAKENTYSQTEYLKRMYVTKSENKLTLHFTVISKSGEKISRFINFTRLKRYFTEYQKRS